MKKRLRLRCQDVTRDYIEVSTGLACKGLFVEIYETHGFKCVYLSKNQAKMLRVWITKWLREQGVD